MADKVPWRGRVTSVQPRIRLTRSFDQRNHTYLGYVLQLDGTIGTETRTFSIGIGKGAQSKHSFRVGDEVAGECLPVADERLEPAEFYKASKLKVLARCAEPPSAPPPWMGTPPDLPTYRERGHRRLDARTHAQACAGCQWGCRMPVEMIIDQWNPTQRKYRFETFCYGPKSCALYRPGPTRKVPGRRGMTWEEEDWIDEDATGHRGPDE
ncbi:MAG: hypothetical protein KAY32_12840 [Candidatus Eisenbacteria sp.]|nr:hypothetical protein [Candidatus Eisenbacteria bacterium]